MRRLNIVKDKKIQTLSFLTKKDFVKYLRSNLDFHGVFKIADDVWNLNVGKGITYFGYTFSINSKRRVGNQLTDGTIIGAEQ